eukprot:1939417-Lingulodinium_polyedra.AAC.1
MASAPRFAAAGYEPTAGRGWRSAMRTWPACPPRPCCSRGPAAARRACSRWRRRSRPCRASSSGRRTTS